MVAVTLGGNGINVINKVTLQSHVSTEMGDTCSTTPVIWTIFTD